MGRGEAFGKIGEHTTSIAQPWGALALFGMLASGCYVGADEGESAASDGGTEGADGADGADGVDDADGSDGGGDDGVPTGCEVVDPGPAPVRRLTREQLVYTIEDVLGVDMAEQAADILPEDLREEGFTNTAAALVATFSHVQGYRTLAAATGNALPDSGAFVGQYTHCTDFTDECEIAYIKGLGRRLFRRPLTAQQVADFRGPFRAAEDEDDGFEVGARLALVSMLQAPQFLYRLEGQAPDDGGTVRALDDYEVASRLSYLLWSSAPDETLLELADDARLTDPATLREQAERLLDDEKARRVSQRYARDWLALDRLDTSSRDGDLYPEFDASLASAMKQETLAVFDAVAWEEQAPLWSLLTRQTTLATPKVAAVYGLPSAGDGLVEYDLSSEPDRIGILTHPGVLTAMSDRDEPSLVERALFIYDDVLCATVPPPPPGVDQSDNDAEEGLSQRDVSESRIAKTACSGCHGLFDPMAYALMQFDAIGAHRTTDEHGNTLRSDGVFDDPSDAGDPIAFDDIDAFVNTLADSPGVAQCMVEKHVQFTLGRPLQSEDACTVDRVGAAFMQGGGTWREMALALVTDPTFLVVQAG
ncbi:MAG: DUF1592 domain-containing protein [Myxococcota bacterium]